MANWRFLGMTFAVLWVISSVCSPVVQSIEQTTQPSTEVRWLAVARDAAGILWAAWEVDDGSDVEIYFSRRIGGEWTAPQPVHRRPGAWDRTPALTALTNGEVWLAWSSADRSNPRQSRVYISRWRGGRWSAPEAVPRGPATKAKEPVLAAAPDGTVWLAWVGFDGVDDEIFAQRWDGATWSFPVQVNAPDSDRTLYDRQPRLAVGRDGNPWLVWTSHQAGPDDEIMASRWTGTGWSPEQLVSNDDDALDVSPSLAVDGQGRPWVAWYGRMAEGENSRLRILTAHWDAASSAWTAEAMASSPLALEIDETSPALLRDGRGEMHLVWVTSGRFGSALAHASRQDGRWTAPELVHFPAQDDAVVPILDEGGQLLMLQLDPASEARAPLEGTRLGKERAPLAQWVQRSATSEQVQAPPIRNRYLAFGDSITWGQYGGLYPYPARLEDKLDTRVIPSEVINSGVPGETTNRGRDRIAGEVSNYQPEFILYMEGTNDVSHLKPPAIVYDNIRVTIYNARHAGVDNVKFMVATIVPRLDNLNDETEEMNEQAIKPAAQSRNAPVCDQWQAFYNYGPWRQIYWDEKHPDGTGLQLIADTFYQCILTNYTWLKEDTTPPTTWIEPLPAQTECGSFTVRWNGTDNLNYVVSYDVQRQVNYGPWTDWIVATPSTSAVYTSNQYGQVIGFRVRGRDLLGNQSEYSAPVYTQISDSGPPEAHMNALPPAQTAPFRVSWRGTDACSSVVAYNVQYRVGAGGVWQVWKTATTSTSDAFAPAVPQYGETYYFRVQARDAAGNWSLWSDPSEAYTKLAQFSVVGRVLNGRHQPVAGASVILNPPSLWTRPQPLGGFQAYVVAAGAYNLTVSRPDRFGPLPPMNDLPVNSNVTGLEFVLPPQDNGVTDGQFESGNLNAWQLGGTLPPTLTSTAHTGQWAVRLGGVGHDSSLSQAVSLGPALTDPTLSFLVRLETGGAASAVQVTLAAAGESPVAFTWPVESDRWTHAWFDLTGLGSGPFTLTLAVADAPPVLVDEISLGSSRPGSYPAYLPVVYRAW